MRYVSLRSAERRKGGLPPTAFYLPISCLIHYMRPASTIISSEQRRTLTVTRNDGLIITVTRNDGLIITVTRNDGLITTGDETTRNQYARRNKHRSTE